MPEERLKTLLGELRQELTSIEELDDEDVESLEQLEATIDDLLNPEVDTDDNSVVDDVVALEAKLTANYPMAAQILREMINTLNRIGI